MTAPREGGTAPSSTADAATPARRTADLQVGNVDPWSVLRYAAVVSVFGFLVWMATAFFMYQVLSAVGLIDSFRDLSASLFKEDALEQVNGYLTLGTAMRLAAVVGVIFSILGVALATVLSFVHNIVARLTGGVTVSFRSK